MLGISYFELLLVLGLGSVILGTLIVPFELLVFHLCQQVLHNSS